MSFVPRKDTTGMENSKWWYSSGNPFYPTYGLPNCTCYAYGRYAEIRNEFARLPTSNAGKWYSQATNFKRSKKPSLGAVVCWSTSVNTPNPASNVGHVAIVEEIYDNGDFLVSYSAWGGSYFSTKIITKASGYSDGFGLNYNFDGFIHNIEFPYTNPLPSARWNAKQTGGYSLESKEAFQNAIMIYKYFSNKGYSDNSIFGILGNIGGEGGFNPWRWESDIIISSNDITSLNSSNHGYGLFGFTPSAKYILNDNAKGYSGYAPNFLNKKGNPNDGNAQLSFVHYDMHTFYDRWNFYGLTNPTSIKSYDDYINSNETVQNLTKVWCVMWEGPASYGLNFDGRINNALYWQNKFSEYDGFYDEEVKQEKTRKSMPIWMMIGRRY